MEIRRAVPFALLLSCAALTAQDSRILPVGFSKKAGPLDAPPVGASPARLPITLENAVPKKPESATVEGGPKEFDSRLVSTKFQDGHWVVLAGKDVLRDCGVDMMQAETIARVVRDSRFTHRGEIAGANPPFEYWLTSVADPTTGKTVQAAAETTAGSTNMLAIDVGTLRVESVAGAWCIRDGRQVLYNFGPRESAAREAHAVMLKYGFNAQGRIGQPRPMMTYMMKGPFRNIDAGKPVKVSSGFPGDRFLADGYYVAELGNVGHRKPIDHRNLKLVRGREWQLLAGSELLAQFGTDETAARTMQKAFEDWRINEYVEVGEAGFRVYMAGGQAPRAAPFNARVIDFQAKDLAVVKRDERYWLMAGRTELYDCGTNEADAKRMMAVVKQMRAEKTVTLGTPRYGEWKFFVRGW